MIVVLSMGRKTSRRAPAQARDLDHGGYEAHVSPASGLPYYPEASVGIHDANMQTPGCAKKRCRCSPRCGRRRPQRLGHEPREGEQPAPPPAHVEQGPDGGGRARVHHAVAHKVDRVQRLNRLGEGRDEGLAVGREDLSVGQVDVRARRRSTKVAKRWHRPQSPSSRSTSRVVPRSLTGPPRCSTCGP